MLTMPQLRAVVYRGTVLDTIDDDGRKHDERGRFARKDGSAASQIGGKKEAKAHASKVLQGAPVASLRIGDAPRGYPALREWASKLFKAAGGKAISPELGEVALDDRAVRDSMAHGMNPYKAAAFAAVKDVIEKGVVVLKSAHGRDMTSAYVSAPVRIDGADDVVTVLVRKDPNSQRMYLHSVTTKENLLKARDSGTDADFGVERSGKVTSGDVASVLHELLNFKGGINGD
ncbi:hypothetical protein [Pandoraea apista]|uniref:LPD3 domain-containing protein n=1 Tax=Pandoraea apista TaxID=93218 RepID=UPI00058ABA8E|nr:hypothetical protein [Pandoraea apista]AJE99632.1 hypothetical protein SG18_18085 [Pandoraea apista]AKH73754.1 hypothetical protein XM39_18275 [Pandoraea apista]AKI62302.1 hypothetical protein AA956_11590 [Pandoraea apista]